MKKLILLLLLPIFAHGQEWKQHFAVPNKSTPFRVAIPKNTVVFEFDSTAWFKITRLMSATDSMTTVFRGGYYTRVSGGGGTSIDTSRLVQKKDSGVVYVTPHALSDSLKYVGNGNVVVIGEGGVKSFRGTTSATRGSALKSAFAYASAYDQIIIGSGMYDVDEPLTIKTNQTIVLQGSFIVANGAYPLFQTDTDASYWKLMGSGTLYGDLAGSAITMNGYCSNYQITGLNINSFFNSINVNYSVGEIYSNTIQSDQGVAITILADGNHNSDYNSIHDNSIYGCGSYAISTMSGNCIINSNIIRNNGGGVYVGPGYNNGHGIISSNNINHNGSGIVFDNLDYGETAIGNHILVNDTNVIVNASAGVNIQGGMIYEGKRHDIYLKGTFTKYNYITGVNSAETSLSIYASSLQRAKLIISGCFNSSSTHPNYNDSITTGMSSDSLLVTRLGKSYKVKNNTGSYLTTETDPTISAWAKAATKPSYTYSEVGAQPSGTYVTAVTGTSPVVSSGGTTPAISINSDTLSSWRGKMNQGAKAFTWSDWSSAVALKAPLASPTFTGTVTLPAANYTVSVTYATSAGTATTATTALGLSAGTYSVSITGNAGTATTAGNISLAGTAGYSLRYISGQWRAWPDSVGGGSTTDSTFNKLSASYASTTTFTMTGTQLKADRMWGSLLRWESSGGAIRYGWIEKATYSAGTVTATCYGTAAMASGDKNYYYAPEIKAREFERRITVPGYTSTDASNPVGMWFQGNASDSLAVFDVSAWVLTAAAGTGSPACAFNLYHGSTALFSSAIDLGTGTSSLHNAPTAVTVVPPSTNMTLRITSAVGTTNTAADFQCRYFAIPTRIYWGL